MTAEEKAQRTAEVLNKQIDVQKKRVDALNSMLEKSADLYGENDIKTLKWQEMGYRGQRTRLVGEDTVQGWC